MNEYKAIKEIVNALLLLFTIAVALGAVMHFNDSSWGIYLVSVGIFGLLISFVCYMLVRIAVDVSEVILWMRVDQDEKDINSKAVK